MTTPLPGNADDAERRLIFDTVSLVDADDAANLLALGYAGCCRYISRGRTITGKGLHRDEAEVILGAGLGLMPVQFALRNLMPSTSEGSRTGVNAARNATALGFAPGVTVWCDAEAFAKDATTDDAIAYVNAWHAPVADAGFMPGLYVGPGSRLPTSVLYSRLRFTCYWASAARIGNVDTRGWALVQSLSHTVAGVHIDSNIARIDAKGGRPVWQSPGVAVEPPCEQDRCE